MGWGQDGKEKKNMQGRDAAQPEQFAALEARTRGGADRSRAVSHGRGGEEAGAYLLWGLQARFLGLQHTPAARSYGHNLGCSICRITDSTHDL